MLNRIQRNSENKRQKRVKPTDRKFIDMNSPHGKAANRQGTQIPARHAGGASEHFEPGRTKGIAHTSGSNKKIIKGKDKHQKQKGREKRIVSG